jgi:Phosphotransferase enzyme family
MDADERRVRALRAAGLADRPMLRGSGTHEVWIADSFVLRVNAGARRLYREAAVAARLPPEARYPGVLDAGDDGTIEWLVTRRVRGDSLLGAWPAMSARRQESATRQLASALRAFHASPADDVDLAPPHTLPLEALVALAREIEPAAEAFVIARWSAFDGENIGLVHGDPHLENVLWDGSELWLIDLEWSRRSWLECDLETLLAVADHPSLFAVSDYEEIGDHREMPRWLRDEYPAWFAHPRLRERLEVLFVSRTLGLIAEYPDSEVWRRHLHAALAGHAPLAMPT